MRALVLAGIALVFAAPLAAQQHHGEKHHGGMAAGQSHAMCQEMMKGGGMLGGVMLFAPDQLLKQSDRLALTADQIARLTALRDAAAKAANEAHQPGMAAHQNLDRALKETPRDTTAIRQFFMAHHMAMGNTHWIMANAALEARAVLTEAQRALVK